MRSGERSKFHNEVEVELVKERNVCTRKVPFVVTEVVSIVPYKNIGSLFQFAIDSIFGRKTLVVLVEIEWPTNRRKRRKKKTVSDDDLRYLRFVSFRSRIYNSYYAN